ncbi:DUF2071 domain-containing protein [Neobacillus mesonae]|nr:DUF2071 domain-containing protein [Neobacillus mesonae]
MNNKEILEVTEHRPFPLPKGFWVMKQVWKDLLFVHWPLSPEELEPSIPLGLDLDTRDGKAWVTISPFRMDPIQIRGVPAIPGVSRMLELNVRTYVIKNGKPGVFFFTLEASNPIAVTAARLVGHLPYNTAHMDISSHSGRFHYLSSRKTAVEGNAIFEGKYAPKDNEVFNAEKGTLLYWLTERYCLYTSDAKSTIYSGDIHHPPWPLQEAELQMQQNTLLSLTGIAVDAMMPPSLLTYTKQLEVLIWPIKSVDHD